MEVRAKIRKIFIITLLLILSGCAAKEKQAFERGKQLLDEGQYAQAVAEFDKAIEIHGGKNIRGLEIDILRYRAEAEYKIEDYKAAEHTYKLLISADEERTEYLDMLAIIYTRLCDMDMDIDIEDAIAMYEKAEDTNSELHINAGIVIAQYYEEMYDKNMDTSYLDISEEYFKKLLTKTGRKNAKVLAVYAHHMAKREDYEKTLETVEEGLALLEGKKLDDNNLEALKSLTLSRAACYEYLGDYKKALEYFKEYVDKYGANDEILHEVDFLESRIR